MRNGRGEIIENTRNAAATNYLHGSSSVLPSLQTQVEELKAGDKKTVYLKSGEAFVDDDFSFEVIIDAVREALPEEIMLGYAVNINSQECDENCDCYSTGKHTESITARS
jgi:FKBP-type peptidyl-prolyl cis-trans isomerase 2